MPALEYTSPRTGKVYEWRPEDDSTPTDEDAQWFVGLIDKQETDTLQPKGEAALASVVQGALGILPSVTKGVGALIPGEGGESIRRQGQAMQQGLEESVPANPVYQDTKTAKAAGALGQGLGYLGAALVSPPSVILGMAGLSGAGAGADLSDQLGLTGGRRAVATVGYGLAEAGSERLFGLGSPKFLKGAGSPATEFGKAVLGEGVEEPAAGVLQDLAQNLAVAGTDKPRASPLDPAKRFEEFAYGVVGAAAFGGVAAFQAQRLQGARLIAEVEGQIVELDPNVTERQVADMGLRPDQVKVVLPDPALQQAVNATDDPAVRQTLQEVMLASAPKENVFDVPGDAVAEFDALAPEEPITPLADEEERQGQGLQEVALPETTNPTMEGSAPGGVGDLTSSGEGPATGSSAPAVSVSNSEGAQLPVNGEVTPTTVADLARSNVTAERNVDPAAFRAQRVAEFQKVAQDPDVEPSAQSFSVGQPPQNPMSPAEIRARVAVRHRLPPDRVSIVNRPDLNRYGWIVKNTGKVFINAPYIRDAAHLDETLYHEYIHRIEYDPIFQKDIRAAMSTFSREDLDALDDIIARAGYDINEIPTERQAVALSRAATAFRTRPGFKQLVQRIKTWFKQQFGQASDQQDAEAIAARIVAKSMAQARSERAVVTRPGSTNVRRSALPENTEVTLTANTRKGAVQLSMDAQEAEAMLEKRENVLQALLDCLKS